MSDHPPYLTVRDAVADVGLDGLPHGTASILRVERPDGVIRFAEIGPTGELRTLDGAGELVPVDWTVVPKPGRSP